MNTYWVQDICVPLYSSMGYLYPPGTADDRLTSLEEELILVLVEGDVHESASQAVVGEDEEDRLQPVVDLGKVL